MRKEIKFKICFKIVLMQILGFFRKSFIDGQ